MVSYYKDGKSIPTEIKKYLKTEQEFRDEAPVIQSSSIVKPNAENRHHLYVLDNLSKGVEFHDEVINSLDHVTIPLKATAF